MARVKYYSADRKLYPLIKTEYVRRGGRWVPTSKETDLISYNQTKNVLSKEGLPFERSHRLEKKDRYGHNEPFDTFSSISPDGRKKASWQVDFRKGHENYVRLAQKSYYDRERYRRRKSSKK